MIQGLIDPGPIDLITVKRISNKHLTRHLCTTEIAFLVPHHQDGYETLNLSNADWEF